MELFTFSPHKDTISLSLAPLISALEKPFSRNKSMSSWKHSPFWNFINAALLPIENTFDVVSQPNKAWLLVSHHIHIAPAFTCKAYTPYFEFTFIYLSGMNETLFCTFFHLLKK